MVTAYLITTVVLQILSSGIYLAQKKNAEASTAFAFAVFGAIAMVSYVGAR